ncbi:MAG: helix-turn-helix domain-containing protein [Oscillospiraceae bacterium]|nr:helix-turn-helix domain-containing protein [Oscillospiraceae bacterium]
MEKETTKRTVKEKNISITEAYEIMFKDYPDVVNIKELSEMLGICSKKAYELVHSGAIPVLPCSKCYKIAKLDVIGYMLNSA